MRVWPGKKGSKPFKNDVYEFGEGRLYAKKVGRMNMSNTFQSAESTDINYRQAIPLY